MNARIDTIDPASLKHIDREVIIPRPRFDEILHMRDWTIAQLSRGEFPSGAKNLGEWQLIEICRQRSLWAQFFLREPGDPDHKDPFNFFDYQLESVDYDAHTIHCCGAEVGKTREILCRVMHAVFTNTNGSGLVGAPLLAQALEVADMIQQQLRWNKDLKSSLLEYRKHPVHKMVFSNEFIIDFRGAGYDGAAYRGVHATTFGIIDEAAKKKNLDQWTEFYRALKPTATLHVYSVPDGDRACQFYLLKERAKAHTGHDFDKEAADAKIAGMPKGLASAKLRYFQFAKPMMPAPFWSEERKEFYVGLYGSTDNAKYLQNVLGEDGDPVNSVFPWESFRKVLKDAPGYRSLKIIVDRNHQTVDIEGHGVKVSAVDGHVGHEKLRLMHERHPESTFSVRQTIKGFFSSIPGAFYFGADLGFSQDPTEMVVLQKIGRVHRLVARLSIRGMEYTQQADAADALDDVFGFVGMANDDGNAGTAFRQSMQGHHEVDGARRENFPDKNYRDRLTGVMFKEKITAVDRDNNILVDEAKTKERRRKDGDHAPSVPLRQDAKHVATTLLEIGMQEQLDEYPFDPDIINFFTNHTRRINGDSIIYDKSNDHLIDACRVAQLRIAWGMEAPSRGSFIASASGYFSESA